AAEHLAELPGDALFDQLLTDAEAIEDFQRALRPADAARAFADAVGVVDQYHRHAAQAEIDGAGQAHRPGAYHDHRPPHRRRRILIGRPAVAVGVDRLVRVRAHPPCP